MTTKKCRFNFICKKFQEKTRTKRKRLKEQGSIKKHKEKNKVKGEESESVPKTIKNV